MAEAPMGAGCGGVTTSATQPSGGAPPSLAAAGAASALGRGDGSVQACAMQMRVPLQSVSLPQPAGSVASGGQPASATTVRTMAIRASDGVGLTPGPGA